MQWLLFGDLVDAAGTKVAPVDVDPPATIEDALAALVADHPELEPLVYDGDELAEPVHVLHNHRSVLDEAGLTTELAPDDELALLLLDTAVEG